MKQFLLVGLGGFVGSVLRYGVGLWMTKTPTTFPIGTTIVNLTGSLLIGILFGLAMKNNQPVFWFGVVGFCGGFTTFSTFSMEAIQLIRNDMWVPLISYLAISLIGGLLLCALGLWLGRMLIN